MFATGLGIIAPATLPVTAPIATICTIGGGAYAVVQMHAAYKGGGPDTSPRRENADYAGGILDGISTTAQFIPGPIGDGIGATAAICKGATGMYRLFLTAWDVRKQGTAPTFD